MKISTINSKKIPSGDKMNKCIIGHKCLDEEKIKLNQVGKIITNVTVAKLQNDDNNKNASHKQNENTTKVIHQSKKKIILKIFENKENIDIEYKAIKMATATNKQTNKQKLYLDEQRLF